MERAPAPSVGMLNSSEEALEHKRYSNGGSDILTLRRNFMLMFSSLQKAVQAGFTYLDFRRDLGVYLVEKTFTREDGKMVKAIALVQASEVADRGGCH